MDCCFTFILILTFIFYFFILETDLLEINILLQQNAQTISDGLCLDCDPEVTQTVQM